MEEENKKVDGDAEEKEFDWNLIQFPVVKNIQPTLLADRLPSMTFEEVAKEMGKLFKKFEKKTGFKPVIVGDSMPTRVLFPKENIVKKTKHGRIKRNKKK